MTLLLVLRRVLLSLPLVLVVSFLAFLLSKLSGGNYFDQFKTDRRFDPAQIRLWEREARLDQPLLVQYAHWLRGVCFDVKIARRRQVLLDFETPRPEGDPARVSAGARISRTSEETRDGVRALRIQFPEEGGRVFLQIPDPLNGWGEFQSLCCSWFSPRASVLRFGWEGEDFERVSFHAERWTDAEIPVPPARGPWLCIAAEGAETVLLDAVAAREKEWRITAGAPDFGRSFYYDTPVFQLLWPNLWNSFVLSFLTLLVTWMIALPTGIWCAVHKHGRADRWFSAFSFVGMSIPNFFLALLLLYVTVEFLNRIFPFPLLPIGFDRSLEIADRNALGTAADRAWHLILPVIVLSLGSVAAIQRVTRSSLLEVLRQNYVTTARAKGLPERQVVVRHALRNAMHPLITLFGFRLAELLSGAALVEIVFQYPGMGKFVLEATLHRDLYVVMASVLVGSLLLVVANLVADVLLLWIDPRIQLESAAR